MRSRTVRPCSARALPGPLAVALAAAVLAGAAALGPAPARADLDVVFLLDTTGSMSRELREAKERVVQLGASLARVREGERLRFGIVAYRDRGDDYVTRLSALTEDVETSRAFLATLRAEGGGDGPESVVAGLAAALRDLNWDLAPATERQIFLIGDAPPHLDYGDEPTPEELIEEARRLEIVVNAIGCRSLPSHGVAFFRRLAYATEGSYQHIGRVRAAEARAEGAGGAEGGLAGALIRAVAEGRQDEPVDRGQGLGPSWIRHDPEAAGRGILVRLGGAVAAEQRREGGPALPCTLEVHLPPGAALAGDPEVHLNEAGLHVLLDLIPGEGGLDVYALDRCPELATPVHVALGGE